MWRHTLSNYGYEFDKGVYGVEVLRELSGYEIIMWLKQIENKKIDISEV